MELVGPPFQWTSQDAVLLADDQLCEYKMAVCLTYVEVMFLKRHMLVEILEQFPEEQVVRDTLRGAFFCQIRYSFLGYEWI